MCARLNASAASQKSIRLALSATSLSLVPSPPPPRYASWEEAIVPGQALKVGSLRVRPFMWRDKSCQLRIDKNGLRHPWGIRIVRDHREQGPNSRAEATESAMATSY